MVLRKRHISFAHETGPFALVFAAVWVIVAVVLASMIFSGAGKMGAL